MDISRRQALSILGAATLGPPNGNSIAAGWASSFPAAPPAENAKLTQADVTALMKELSNWGRWGPDDQLGAINLITPAKRKAAAAIVKSGQAISLAHDTSTEKTVDNNPPFEQKMISSGLDATAIFAKDQYTFAYHTLYITHLDALCHVFYGDQIYNGYSRRLVTHEGAKTLDVLKMKDGIFTRGYLFDIPRLKGKPYLEPTEAIYPEDLDAWEKHAGVKVEPGDAVLIRTGRWPRRTKFGPYAEPAAGLHASCAHWLHQRDAAVLGSDNASDVMPSGIEGVTMPIHLLAVAAMGMPILDNVDLERAAEVAATHHRWVFLLTVAPDPVPGGTGSPVNPTAVF